MFESPLDAQMKASRSRSTVIIGVTAIVFTVVISLTVYVSQRRASKGVEVIEPYRAGSPQFEGYRRFIQLEQQEHDAAENMLRQVQVEARAILFNNGDRTLTQVEVRAVVYDLDGNEIADRLSLQVPKVLPELGPGESMLVEVNVNTVPAGSIPAAARVLLHGLRLKEVEGSESPWVSPPSQLLADANFNRRSRWPFPIPGLGLRGRALSGRRSDR